MFLMNMKPDNSNLYTETANLAYVAMCFELFLIKIGEF